MTGRRSADTPQVILHSTRHERVTVNVELAIDPDEMARGLMFRDHIAAGWGMLFIYPSSGRHSFWMKNTYIPLDLIFVAPDGRIVNIIENARPLSLAPLASTAPVTAVLEVAGGTAARLGIRPGHGLKIVEAAPGA